MAIKHERSQQLNSSPMSQKRRSALKKMLVGTGVAAGAAVLPDKWVKPVVDKVLVPAHAATSCPELPANYRGVIDIVEQQTKVSLWDTLEEAVIPSAHAGVNLEIDVADLCITVNCDPATGKITFESVLSIYNVGGTGYYLTGKGEVGGPTVAMTIEGNCITEASIEVTAIDPDKAQFSILYREIGLQFSSLTSEIGPGSGCPEPPSSLYNCG